MFDINRARIVTGIRQSADDAAYWHLQSHDGSSIWVTKEHLRIEHDPTLESESGCVLLDVMGTQSIIAAADREALLAFFKDAGVMFPGFSPRHARAAN